MAGIEWGEDVQGCVLLLLKSINGLRTSGARWYERLAEVLIKFGFKPCLAGVFLWFRRNDEGTYDLLLFTLMIFLLQLRMPLPSSVLLE